MGTNCGLVAKLWKKNVLVVRFQIGHKAAFFARNKQRMTESAVKSAIGVAVSGSKHLLLSVRRSNS